MLRSNPIAANLIAQFGQTYILQGMHITNYVLKIIYIGEVLPHLFVKLINVVWKLAISHESE